MKGYRKIINSKNINCPYSVLKKIYKKHKNIREYIIKHPNWVLKDFT